MRSLFHTAFSPSFRFRVFIILFLGVGYACGMTASTIVPDLYCGVAAPCQEKACQAEHNEDDCDDGNADDCCASDTSECCFGGSTPTVLMTVQCDAVSLPESKVFLASDEIPLFLSTPPIHQPPRFQKYAAV